MSNKMMRSRTRGAMLGIVVLFALGSEAFGQFPGERDTQEGLRHYRVAQLAIQKNDLVIASEELNEAARLTPGNALVWYSLAVVESRRRNPRKAQEDLNRALKIGLPESERAKAEDLLISITYEVKKLARQEQEVSDKKNQVAERLGAALAKSDFTVDLYSYYDGVWLTKNEAGTTRTGRQTTHDVKYGFTWNSVVAPDYECNFYECTVRIVCSGGSKCISRDGSVDLFLPREVSSLTLAFSRSNPGAPEGAQDVATLLRVLIRASK